VIVARNLDPPYRYSQEYIWYEVTAEDQIHAIQKAQEWANSQGLEGSDMVRLKRQYEEKYAGYPVKWNVPIVSDAPSGAMVRDPVTGLRLGYVGWPVDEAKVDGDLVARGYRLINARPSAYSKPLFLAPLVSSVEYSFQRI